MRLLLELTSTKDFEYDLKYYHKLQGFIYSLLRDTPYSILHDKKGYKFFCFSNIFPVPEDGKIKRGDKKKLLISSPDKLFINFLEEKVKERKEINIGEMQFELNNVKRFNVKLKKNFKLITATPIIIRIPEKNYEKYKIPMEFRKKRYVYWRPQYSFEAFVKQLEENLIKKYNEFYNVKFEIERIFEMFKFVKSTVNHTIINGKEQMLVGSIWEFGFSYLNPEQKKILEFGIDCGFGERNSLGFGFMNVVR
jgi:CRISPR-associated endoribonuclease Cas6